MRRIPQTSLSNPINPEDLEQSRLFWIKQVQASWFATDLNTLRKGDLLPKTSHLIRLTPFIDSEGVMRVGGRLSNAKLDPDAKHPIILPRTSPLSTLIIEDAHKKTLHGGTHSTFGFLRQSYWILGGRISVRSHILRCVRCSRYRQLRAQLMGQLPHSRVTPARPFYNTGIDYAGPINIKAWKGRTSRLYKGYIAIFVCLVTSAVHIELVAEYSTEAFIAALKRFTGRRGICATLQSDCGTNFIGAERELRQRFSAESKELLQLSRLLANDGTRWIFNPPSAPHFGGKWEAAVKLTKYHLKRILGDTNLTYEELSTTLIQIEAVLNSRPLCPLSEDPTDYEAFLSVLSKSVLNKS